MTEEEKVRLLTIVAIEFARCLDPLPCESDPILLDIFDPDTGWSVENLQQHCESCDDCAPFLNVLNDPAQRADFVAALRDAAPPGKSR
jgi:hypothetical protein